MKQRIGSLFLGLTVAAASLSGCGAQSRETDAQEFPDAVSIDLSDDGITVDGEAVSADETAAVYMAHDIIYYESGRDFTYGEGTEADAHTVDEAEAHTVVHITQPGTYALSGTLSAGQIAVDLGEGAADDQSAVVTLILNGVDITCTVAPAVIFYNVYECSSTDEDTASETVDTSAAGANVLIADGTLNNISGSYVARIYDPDTVVLSDDGTEVVEEKKLHKYDGAFYSKMSMNVNGGEAGTGVLNITADNEGLDTELHLTINGGTVAASGNMYDQIDGGAQTYAVFSFATGQAGGETYTLQNADGETVGTWTPANDFTYLVVSSPDLTAGDYTLWQGDTQLAGSASDGMGGPGGGGGRPIGGGEPSADFDPQQAPEGEVSPAGERPQRPEGEAPTDLQENAGGEAPADPPERPEGEAAPDGAEPPADGRGPGGGGGSQSAADLSETFTLTDGGNFFTGISQLDAAESSGS